MKHSSELLIVGSLLALSCGRPDAAIREVEGFRTAVASKSYHGIYVSADPEFRQAGTEPHFVEFMNGLEGKLGPWQSAPEPVWTVFNGSGGRKVTLVYQSQFANGSASEQFIWRINRGRASLISYHVDSPLLATR